MPEYPGLDVVINYGSLDVGGTGESWVLIGQQRDGSDEVTDETVDATHKDNAGWASFVAIRSSWKISLAGVMNHADTALTALRAAVRSRIAKWFQIDKSGLAVPGPVEEGQAFITSFNESYSVGDLLGYTMELLGTGPLIPSP